jgi:GH15 family glucan-1,4-alpha-glucosidase
VDVGDYGLIGDTRTAALISSRGAIDWMCFPRFDSPPLFGRLVGGDEGGTFAVDLDDLRDVHRRYLDGSAVLETELRTGTGVATATDGMVADTGGRLLPQGLVVRRLRCREGLVRGAVLFDPRRDWTSIPQRAERRSGALHCTWGPLVATLRTAPDASIVPGRPAPFDLGAGEEIVLVLGLDHREPAVIVEPEAAVRELDRTDAWWRGWSGALRVPAEAEDAVGRSLITLRLLTYAPSGAPVAAPTTSLPEIPGGSKNWDYRYAWIRDASMGVSAFLSAGSAAEPKAFLWWMLHASRRTRPDLRVVYDVLGNDRIDELERPELPGFQGARPVRVGNAAADQFQVDAYAWMIDAGWAFLRSTGDLFGETWQALRGHADLLAERWSEPDHGIWELRGDPRHFVHSKLMAWVGLDRAIRIAGRLGVRQRRLDRWNDARRLVHEDIVERGYDDELGTYTQVYGSRGFDASLLAMPVTGIEPADSPRMRSTVEAVRERLGAGGPLVYRFEPDGEGAFLPCSFWLSRALAAIGAVDEAREVFEDTCALATDLGLFAEMMDPTTRRHTGNVPQAFTHAALVEAAVELERAAEVSEVRAPRTPPGSLRT